MFKNIKGKLGITAGIIALLTLFVLGQAGPLVRFPAGSETDPGLALYLERDMGFYKDASADMGFGFETMTFEGSTADAFETQIQVVDPTVDATYIFRDTINVDSYHVVATPDGDLASSYFANPLLASSTDADDILDTSVADDDMVVYTVYLPFPMTVGAVYAGADFIADSGADELLGIGIYENADAGVRLFSCVSAEITVDGALDCDGTDVNLMPGFYRVGFCSGDISGVAFVAQTAADDEIRDITNLIPVTTAPVTESANGCTADTAAVPTTTGALTDAETEIAAFYFGQD